MGLQVRGIFVCLECSDSLSWLCDQRDLSVPCSYKDYEVALTLIYNSQ